MRVVSQRQPTRGEMADLLFAWRVANGSSQTPSCCPSQATAGVGAGQMSRVDAVRYAGMKAGERAQGSVMSSDAFFPFRRWHRSRRHLRHHRRHPAGRLHADDEVIAAADRLGLAMVFTGMRHFRH